MSKNIQAEGVKISCSGDAQAAFEINANESDILENPFSIELSNNVSLYIGTIEGGCGQFGCPGHLSASYRLFIDENQKVYKEKIDILPTEISEINSSQIIFRVARYNHSVHTLDCFIE